MNSDSLISDRLRNSLSLRLKSGATGILLSVGTLFLGQVWGLLLGHRNPTVEAWLGDAAAAVKDSVYNGDSHRMAEVGAESWNCLRTASIHAGVMGATGVVLILLVSLRGTRPRTAIPIGLGLGLGALGYSAFWLWTGLRAPSLGSVDAARESLSWLSIPTATAYLLATGSVFVLMARTFLYRCRPFDGLWTQAGRVESVEEDGELGFHPMAERSHRGLDGASRHR
jgi:hypothetical protein